MRYEYKINDDSMVLQANSFKKLLKLLSSKFKAGENVKISYINKKNHKLIKFVKIKKND